MFLEPIQPLHTFHKISTSGLLEPLDHARLALRTNTASLRKTLRGYWKLRVGDYRVMCKIEGEEVWALGIQHRKTVYEDIVQRLGRPR